MPDLSALVAACVAAPDDDDPRLVWADAIGGERGEFVVIQCALARGDRAPADSAKLRRRARELLHAHGKQWSELEGIATRVMFQRGFVEAAEIDTGRFVDEPDDIFRRAPLLRSLTAVGLATRDDEPPVALPKLAALFASPALRRLAGLYIKDPTHCREYDTGQYLHETGYEITSYGDEMFALARDTLSHLRAFGTDCRAGLATANFLGGIERFWPPDHVQNAELLANMPALVAIDLGTTTTVNGTSAAVISQLPAHLRELRVKLGTGDDQPDRLALLVTLPCAATLERLELRSAQLQDASVLGRLPRLRSLRLTEVSLGTSYNPPLERFLDTLPDLPALRELRVFSNLRPESGRRVAERYGPQLELLDLRSAHHLHDANLDELVAGDVRVGSSPPYKSLLHVGEDAAWLEETCLDLSS